MTMDHHAAIRGYYDQTQQSSVRQSLVDAVQLVSTKRTAVDCGCGAGADIAFPATGSPRDLT